MRERTKKNIILLLIATLFILLSALIICLIMLKDEEKSSIGYLNPKNTVIQNSTDESSLENRQKAKTIKEIVEEHESKYISEEPTVVNLTFGQGLYTNNGQSNETFFLELAEDLLPKFRNSAFSMIDEKNNIRINVRVSQDGFKLIINDMEDFYNVINGEDFVAVENAKIVKPSEMYESNPLLTRLSVNNMYFKYIEQYLTEGKELENGYTIYVDEQVKLKLAPNKAVFNIIFLEDYKEHILLDVSLEDDLNDIEQKHKDYTFGGLEKGYLGYRNGNYYYFFYNNEASVYSYTYSENIKFEKFLTEYLETKDLEKFVNDVRYNIKSYSNFEYDPDIQKAYFAFPTRGIKIDIRDNNPKGIVLYSNYYFTETTKDLVKRGQIQYSKEDYVNEYEQMRRESQE